MARRAVRIRDLAEIQMISDPQISPSGCKAAFVRTVIDFEKDEYLSDVWMTDLISGELTQFTAGRGKDKAPRWSPDGRLLAFTSIPAALPNGEKKKPQLYVVAVDGGEARILTDFEGGAASPSWSPDGGSMLVLVNHRDKKPESDVRVIDRLEYRYNGKGFYDGRRSHVFVVSTRGGKPRQVTTGEHDVSVADWVDARTIAFVGNTDPEADLKKEKFIYLIGSKGGEPRKLTEKPMSIEGLKASPKGDRVAFSGHSWEKGGGTKSNLYVLPIDGGGPLNLTGNLDMNLGNQLSSDARASSTNGAFDWSPDSKWIYFQATFNGAAHLYRVAADGGEPEHIVGEPDHSVEAFSLGPEGKFAYTVLKATEPIELWVKEDKSRQITRLNAEYLKKVDVIHHEQFSFKSSGGHIVEGWIMKPYGWKKEERYPACLEIHGGPRGAYGDGLMHEFQVLAAGGYGVFYINPWGSGGYTENYQAGLPGHYGEQDYKDLMEATDYVTKNYGWVDPKRIAVLGGSYGGFMTNWIVTQTTRFKAAATMRSISNWVSFFGCSDIGWTFGQREVTGVPWEDEEQFMAKSPIRYVKKVKTPTLILHSDEDWRCPSEQGEQFYVALKCLGVPTRLVKFPGENHELSRGGKPKHREERLKHILGWFKEYLE